MIIQIVERKVNSMLITAKSTTLNGTSSVNGETVATMYAIVNEDGSCNQNNNIVNSSLYEVNKSEVRADIAAFYEKVYKLQDGE